MIVPLEGSSSRNVRFAFVEVVKAKVAASLLASKKRNGTGKKLDKEICAAVERLGEFLSEAGGILEGSGISVFSEGLKIVFQTDHYKMEGSSGQLLFQFDRFPGAVTDNAVLRRVV